MKMTSMIAFGLLSSLSAMADPVDFSKFSQALVSTAGPIAKMVGTCGQSVENVTAASPSDGVTEYRFQLVRRGVGRLGGKIFALCEVSIIEDTTPARMDLGVSYTAEFRQLK